jgi:tripartite-type tricarboxylate transporter receptor subunit TctC
VLHRRSLIATGLAGLALPAVARAQSGWKPRQPIRLIATFPPGGLADVVARLVAPAIAQNLGGTIVVENRPGAGGTIGADAAARAAPDGHTLVISHASPNGIAPGIYPALPYHPVRDFTHIAMLCDTANVLVNKGSATPGLAAFLDKARGPGARYGSSGIGSITHLMGEVLTREARAPKLDHVPCRGSAPAMQDLFANHTERVFDPLTTKVAMIKDGTVVALAVSALHRAQAVPDVPTFAEQGLPVLTATTWIGISGRKSLPAPVADAVQEAALAAIARPEILAKLADLAFYAPPKPLVGTAYTAMIAMIATFASHWIAVAKRGRNHRLLTGGHPMPDAPAVRSRRALATTPLRASSGRATGPSWRHICRQDTHDRHRPRAHECGNTSCPLFPPRAEPRRGAEGCDGARGAAQSLDQRLRCDEPPCAASGRGE